MSHLFNQNMTSSEARRVLFSAVEGKPKEEVEAIKNEYSRIAPAIMRRELSQSRGYMTSDKL